MFVRAFLRGVSGKDGRRAAGGRLALVALLFGLAAPAQVLTNPPLRSTYYDGLTSVVFPHRAEYDSNAAMSVEAWVYRNTSNQFHTIASHNWTTSWWLGISSGNRLRFYRSGGVGQFRDSTLPVPARRWTHVAACYDGARVRFYIDGEAAGDEAMTNAATHRVQELRLGGDVNGGLNLAGYLDEVRVWMTARSPSEIRAGRFVEMTNAPGLAACFPAGGAFNAVAGVSVSASAPARRWGVLPRDLFATRATTAVSYQTLNAFVANEADSVLWRYRDASGAERDVEGYVMYRNETGDQNLYVAVPDTPNRQDTLSALQPWWFSLLLDRNGSGGKDVATNDYRFDSRADHGTNYFYAGDGGSNWVFRASPQPGPGSWDVVPLTGCEFDCARIFRIPATLAGGLLGVKRVMFGAFAYRSGLLAGAALPSPLDAVPNEPDTWPRLVFGGRQAELPTVRVQGFVTDATAGAFTVMTGLVVRLDNPATAEVFASAEVNATGGFVLFGQVYPEGAGVRLSIQPPAGMWRVQDYVIFDPGVVPIVATNPATGLTYAPPPAGVTSSLGQVAFRLAQHRPPTMTNFGPRAGLPRMVLRTAPRQTSAFTAFDIQGTNLHHACQFYLSHLNGPAPVNPGDPLPSGPNVTNFPLRALERALDWTWARVGLDFELDTRFTDPGQQWLRGPYRVLLRDEWSPAWRTVAGAFYLEDNPYPFVHGFSFFNERDGTQFDEFSGVYQWNAYDCITPVGPFYAANPCPGCRSPNPWALTFHSLVFTPWVEAMTGSCLGMSATSLLLARGDLPPASLASGVRHGYGFLGNPTVATNAATGQVETNYLAAPKPQEHRFRVCDYSEPVNLWAHIHRNQSAQISSQFFNHLLDQMDGTGLIPRPDGARLGSIDGNPTNVLARIRANPRDYVFCMQQSGDALKAHAMVAYGTLDGFGLDRTNPVQRMVERSNSTALLVYDPNYPGDATRFVEIDRSANRYYYHWSGELWFETNDLGGGVVEIRTNTAVDLWSGSSCYAAPITLWHTARTPPGAEILARGLALLMFGSADPAYEDAAGGVWGYDAAGAFHDTYEGAKSIAPFGAAESSNRVAMFFPPAHAPPARIGANVRGPQWRFFAGEGGRMFTLEVSNALAGVEDELSIGREWDGLLRSVRYRPAAGAGAITPRLGLLSPGKPPVVFEWLQLNIPAGGAVDFSALPRRAGQLDDDQLGAELRNQSGVLLQYTLRMLVSPSSQGAAGPATNRLGPFVVPAGARHRVEVMEVQAGYLRSLLDTDDDGRYDMITTLAPLPDTPTNAPPPALALCPATSGFCLAWPITPQAWVLESATALGDPLAWRPVPVAPAVAGGTQTVVLDAEAAIRAFGAPLSGMRFFRLRQTP